MSIATRFYEALATPDGTEISEIIGGTPGCNSGYIKQILIAALSGGGSHITFQVRYFSNDSMITNLIYLYENAELPEFAGVNINAPFDLRSKDTPHDLILFLQPELTGFFRIRIDYEFDNK